MKKQFFYLLALCALIGTGCQKELSFEGSNNPAKGSLQADVTGDCLPKTVNGTYAVATPLIADINTITVAVNVLTTGNYVITTDTVNGYFFRATGIFTSPGVNNVTLRGVGTPFAAGINNFVVAFDSTFCDVQVTVTSPGVGTLAGSPNACAPIIVNGGYSPGVALNSSNNAVIQVNVTTAGAFNITTDTVAGVWFTFSGNLPSGPQTVTLQAQGSIPGTTTTGPKTYTVKLGTGRCTFVVNIQAPATGTVDCTGTTPAGTYSVNVPLNPATNTVQIQVNVTASGAYSITTDTVHGIWFNASGNFPTAPATPTITLAGHGTPDAAGTWTYTVKFGTSTCTFTVTVTTPGVAVYTVDCSSAIVNGYYEQGTQLNPSNTVDIDVNVTTIGTYNITTTLNNGMTFSSGPNTFTTTGINTVTLFGSGTPSAQGNFNIQVPGSPACTFPITIDPPLTTYHWNFTVTNAPATIYRGENDNVLFGSNPPIPGTSFVLEGSNAIGSDYFAIVLADVSGTINNGETYSTSATVTNAALFNYDLPLPAADTYSADPGQTGVTMIFTVTNHNVAAKTITGTFTGTAKNSAGQTINITAGNFTATYP